jgi:hypothetical protein
MNDCIYYSMEVCDGMYCNDCKKYTNFDDRGANIIICAYQNEINEAIRPVCDKWRKMFEDGQI